MSFSRTTIIRGPAQIKWGSDYLYSQGDIKLSIGHQVFPIINSAMGLVQERSQQRVATVQFTPVGTYYASLWPYGTKKPGDRLLTDTDQNLEIHSYAGTKCTIYNCAVTKMPDLILSATKTLAGEVTFTGLGKGNPGTGITPQNEDNSFVSFDSTAGAPADFFDPSTVPTQFYTASWNTSSSGSSSNASAPSNPWANIKTQAGWHFTFDLSLQPVDVDEYGTVDWTIGDVKANARATILGYTENQVSDAVHPHILRGAPLDTSNDLVVTYAGATALYAKLYACQARTVPAQFGLTTLRLAEMEWIGTRKVFNTAIMPIFYVGTDMPA